MRLPVHACESWTLDSRAAKKNTSHGNEVLPQDTTRHLYKDRITNEEVWAKTAKIQQEIGPHEDLTIVKRRKLKWYGHFSRSSGLARISVQGTVKEGRR